MGVTFMVGSVQRGPPPPGGRGSGLDSRSISRERSPITAFRMGGGTTGVTMGGRPGVGSAGRSGGTGGRSGGGAGGPSGGGPGGPSGGGTGGSGGRPTAAVTNSSGARSSSV